jgi:hypothetical protein
MYAMATNLNPLRSMNRTKHPHLAAAVTLAGCVITSVGCASGAEPVSDSLASGLATSAVDDELVLAVADGAREARELPAWITEPAEVPEGLRGTNNCAFYVPLAGAQWSFHPDGACWERPGPDGWTRQQQHNVHVPSHPECNGRPADVSPIRVCRNPFEPNPCHMSATTGPNGCAVCVKKVVCHDAP